MLKKSEKWKVANQKSRKIVNFSCFLVFCTVRNFDEQNISYFLVFCTVRNFDLRQIYLFKNFVPRSQITLFIISMNWIQKCRKKKVNSEKLLKKSKNRKFFMFFGVFCTVRNFDIRHKNLFKNFVPRSQITLFIISMNLIRKCCNPKKSKNRRFFMLFGVLYGTKFWLKT
jgi:hypothetical protein